MKSMRNVMLVSAIVALPSLALAQSANAAGGVTGAAQVNHPALPPPPPPPPPTVQAGAAAHSAAAAGANVRAPMVNPAAAHSAASAHAAAGSSPVTGANVNATTHASATGQARGLSTATTVGQNASVTLNAASTVSEIHGAAFATRKELAANIEARLDASQKNVGTLRAKADAGGDRSRREFGRALNEIREREKALRTSLKTTTKATGESTWGEVQSTLAKDYNAYAAAVASAEAAAQGSASTEAPKP